MTNTETNVTVEERIERQADEHVRNSLGLAPHQSDSFTNAILRGLQKKHVWAGDMTPHKTLKRRAANKVARKSRRANR